MKIVSVELTPHYAWITADKTTNQALYDYWSFTPAGAHFAPRHKLWLRCYAAAIRKGLPTDHLPGWDGKIRFLKRGKVPAGLFRATYRDIQDKLGIRFRVETDRPKLFTTWITYAGTRSKWGPKKYDYQWDCILAMHKAVNKGGGIVLMGTGTGKTKTVSDFIDSLVTVQQKAITRMLSDDPDEVPVSDIPILFIVDTLQLMDQARDEICKWTLGEDIGYVGDSKYEVRRVTVATIQTLSRHVNDPKFMKWFRKVQIVIVDELHDQLAKRNFSVLEKIKPHAVFGLTATLELRKKQVRMNAHAFAGPVIYEFPYSEGVKKKVLTKARALQLLFPEEYDWTGRNDYQKEYDREVAGNPEKHAACRAIVKHLIKEGRYTMTLTWRKAHTWALSGVLPEPHRVVCGDVKKDKRARSKNKFEKGEIPLLISSGVFKKGTNIKRVDAIIDMAEMKSRNDTKQKLGRGVRLFKGKDELLYIDFATREGRFSKAAKHRRAALRELGVTVKKVIVNNPA